MSELFLAGKVQVQPSGVTVWWLDEEFQQHSRFVERGQPEPEFSCVTRSGVEVDVQGIGSYSIQYRP